MIEGFRKSFKDLLSVWKPALLTYISAVIISITTGIDINTIFIGFFGVIIVSLLLMLSVECLKYTINKFKSH